MAAAVHGFKAAAGSMAGDGARSAATEAEPTFIRAAAAIRAVEGAIRVAEALPMARRVAGVAKVEATVTASRGRCPARPSGLNADLT
jgi:hypothetical protein